MIEIVPSPLLWTLLIVIAAVIDYFVGDPDFIYHPIRLIGKLIKTLTKLLNRGKARRFKGLILIILVLVTVSIVIILLQYILYRFNNYVYIAFNLWFLSTALCEKSLFKAGQKCKKYLEEDNLEMARKETAKIVGRETKKLKKIDLIKAVIETEAENGIDGIISPLIFMFLGVILSIWVPFLNPLVLAYIYKSINTMDSMVGYLYEPYKDFGFYPANLDDLANYVPSRIGSYLMLFSGKLLGLDDNEAYECYRRDRYSHLSPNAGHPESVIAGLLGIQLGGSHYYNGNLIRKPTIGIKRFKIQIDDIDETFHIVLLSEVFLILGWIVFVIVTTYLLSLFYL